MSANCFRAAVWSVPSCAHGESDHFPHHIIPFQYISFQLLTSIVLSSCRASLFRGLCRCCLLLAGPGEEARRRSHCADARSLTCLCARTLLTLLLIQLHHHHHHPRPHLFVLLVLLPASAFWICHACLLGRTARKYWETWVRHKKEATERRAA